MAVKASVQYTSDLGLQTVSFYDFSDNNTRSFIDYIPFGNVEDNKRFHAPGWNGSALIRGGFIGAQLVLEVRYKDDLTSANSTWRSDREAFAKYSCKITDGDSLYKRCTLRPGSGERTTSEKASGVSGKGFFNVRYVFDIEELN
jgi:hypothetical protein